MFGSEVGPEVMLLTHAVGRKVGAIFELDLRGMETMDTRRFSNHSGLHTGMRECVREDSFFDPLCQNMFVTLWRHVHRAGLARLSLPIKVSIYCEQGHRVSVSFAEEAAERLRVGYDAFHGLSVVVKHLEAGSSWCLDSGLGLGSIFPCPIEPAQQRFPETQELVSRRLPAGFAETSPSPGSLQVVLMTHGYNRQVDSHLWIDARCMRSPESRLLSGHCGMHPGIRKCTRDHPLFEPMLRKLLQRLQVCQGMSTVRVSIFCRSGMHRSVSVAEEVAARIMAGNMVVVVDHLDAASSWPQACRSGTCGSCPGWAPACTPGAWADSDRRPSERFYNV